MAKRTIITRNGALTNSDGSYTLENSPTADTLYWEPGFGWNIQPFMTKVFVETDPIELSEGNIFLPNADDVPVGHTIDFYFEANAYASNEEFKLETCRELLYTPNEQKMALQLGVTSNALGNDQSLNFSVSAGGETTLPILLPDLTGFASDLMKFRVRKIGKVDGNWSNSDCQWQVEVLALVPQGVQTGDVFDI